MFFVSRAWKETSVVFDREQGRDVHGSERRAGERDPVPEARIGLDVKSSCE